MNWRDHITVDPEVRHGKACITGTRVLVTTVLDNLASGLDAEGITRGYPSVSREAVRAALCYAAALASERAAVTFETDAAEIRSIRRRQTPMLDERLNDLERNGSLVRSDIPRRTFRPVERRPPAHFRDLSPSAAIESRVRRLPYSARNGAAVNDHRRL